MAVIAIIQLVVNIIIIVPRNKVIALTKVASDWFIELAIVSTSLVTRDRVSPIEWVSK